MYRKVLVPLSGSTDKEKCLPIVSDVLVPSGEVILFQVIEDESQYDEAMDYLEKVGHEVIGDSTRWHCEVRIGDSVHTEILDAATREGVDLIAIYDEGGDGFLKTITGGTTASMRLFSPVEVKVFGPEDIKTGLPSEELANHLISKSDIFRGLSEEQASKVASLSRWTEAPARQELVTHGAAGQSVYVIKSGDVRLSAPSPVGEITVRIAGPGECFPLATLVGEGDLITSAKALTDTELLEIPRADLIDLCFAEPDIGVMVYSSVANTFANRYRKTLAHLGISAERELKGAGFTANV